MVEEVEVEQQVLGVPVVPVVTVEGQEQALLGILLQTMVLEVEVVDKVALVTLGLVGMVVPVLS
jgi:hypothetical protein